MELDKEPRRSFLLIHPTECIFQRARELIKKKTSKEASRARVLLNEKNDTEGVSSAVVW